MYNCDGRVHFTLDYGEILTYCLTGSFNRIGGYVTFSVVSINKILVYQLGFEKIIVITNKRLDKLVVIKLLEYIRL